jgi:hypothetical protein
LTQLQIEDQEYLINFFEIEEVAELSNKILKLGTKQDPYFNQKIKLED